PPNARAGGCQGCTTVYDPQVILSIKDTPLGPNFRERVLDSNRRTENDRILHRSPIVVAPSPYIGEPQIAIQPPSDRVGFTHLEKHGGDAHLPEAGEHRLYQSPPDALMLASRRHAKVEDLR